MKWKIAALAGVVGLALFIFLPRSTPGSSGQKSGGHLPPTTAVKPVAHATARVEPSPDAPEAEAAAEAMRKAQDYYSGHIDEIWRLLNVDYPQAAAKRKARPDVDAAHEFFKGYADALEKASPLKDFKEAAEKSLDAMEKDKDRLKPLFEVRGGLMIFEAYAGFLADTTAVGSTTVGGIVRESWQTPESFDGSRNILAKVERELLRDETAAAQVETLQSGSELADYLQAAQARYQERQTQATEVLPFTAEQEAVINRMVQIGMMTQVSRGYDATVYGEEWRMQREFLAFQKEMRELLDKLPAEDSPEKREILTGLSDVYTRLKQLDKETATPRAPTWEEVY